MSADLQERPPPVDLIGRAGEVARLLELVAATASGRGAVVVVEGEPGIGKTALLDVLVTECEGVGLRVLRGAGTELEQKIPFQTILSCLASGTGAHRPDVSAVMARVRDARGEGASDWEFSVTEVVIQVLDQWCAQGPGALVVDDLHWADPATLLVLHRLQRALGTLPLLIALAIQPLPSRGDAAALLRVLKARGADTLKPAPLGDRDVALLAERLRGARPPGALLAGLSATAGNPLYVHEMVAAYEQRGASGAFTAMGAPPATDPARRLAPVGGTALPDSLTATVLAGLKPLPRRTRDVLEVAAVLGPRVYVHELASVLGVSVRELWEALSEAVEVGLLRSVDDRLAFRHDLVRQGLAGSVPEAVRTALQVQAWQTLAASGAPVERAAEYLVPADSYVTARVVDWLVRDVDRLVARAPAMAVELLERSLPTLDPDDPRAEPLRRQLARALLRAGEPAAAERTAAQALTAGDVGPAAEGELRWLVAQSVFQQGRVAESVAVAETALASPGIRGAQAARFQALAAQGHYLLGRLDTCEEAARRTVAAGESSGDAYTTAFGLCLLASLRLAALRMVEALELVDRSLTVLGGQEIRPDLQMAPHFVRGLVLMNLERGPEAHQELDAGLHDCERGGNIFLTWYHLGKASLWYYEGRWDDALAEIQAGLEIFDRLGLSQGLQSQAALIAVHRGDSRSYADLVQRQDDTPSGQNLEFLRRWARALTWEANGAPDRALDLLFESWTHGVRAMSQAYLYKLCPDIARLAAMAGDTERLRLVGDALEELAATKTVLSVRATALLCRGAYDHAPEVLVTAAETYHHAGQRLYAGYAREQEAVVLAGLGRGEEARTALNAALDLYGGLGAVWDARRAETRLAAAGVSPGRRSRRSPVTGWDALTGTEREIVAFVAQGCSNPDIGARMFLSHRTVQSHLSNIFSKLGVASRVELAVVAHQRGAEGPESPD
ncbi:helix-turn-helix transcriptional regulator [Streptomyces sp. KR80]|uniref:helix-turn-helix transcriptional regulator n=1 Tax=Streptomyces sp. KR80 TaxID=3457426 RepID=UPI003FD4ADDF